MTEDHNRPTPDEALRLIDFLATEAEILSQPVNDEATLSYRGAIAVVHRMRVKLAEMRAVVAEARWTPTAVAETIEEFLRSDR